MRLEKGKYDAQYPTFVMMRALILFTILMSTGDAQYSKQFAGPFDLIIKEKVPCKDPGTDQMRFISNRISVFNRTTKVYNSEVILPWGITDDIRVLFDVFDYRNGVYKKGIFSDKDMGFMCSSLKQYTKSTSKDIARSLGFNDCPIPPGNYTIKNWIINMVPTIPVLPYHSIRYDFNFVHKDTKVGCISFKADIVPKKNKG